MRKLGGSALARAIAASVAIGAVVLPGTAAAKPNILVIVTDDQRAQGTMQVMPRTRSLFFDQGTRFPQAVVTTPLCCPSRASILTGKYAHNHGVWHNSQNGAELANLDYSSMFPRYLQDAGYTTGIVGKYLNGWDLSQPPPNFDSYDITEGNYHNTSWNLNGTQQVVSQYATAFDGKLASDFINAREAQDRKPWMLYLAPPAPHATFDQNGVSFEPQPRYAHAPVGPFPSNPATQEQDLSDKPPFWRQALQDNPPGTPGLISPQATRAGQLRLLMSADDMVAHVFRTLKKDGERRRTLAIFISDNGLFWGEHGNLPIKDMPWLPSIRVPLALRWPGHVTGGQSDQRLAANIDLAPTILDAAGVTLPSTLDGRSLLQSWSRPYILTEYGGFSNGKINIPPWASLYRPDSFQYTQYRNEGGGTSFQEYYKLASDPWQLDNLLGDSNPANDPPTAGASAALAQARICAGASCP